jgi:hypothetical protein
MILKFPLLMIEPIPVPCETKLLFQQERIAALESALKELENQLDSKARELIAHREKAQGIYWAWQGDGEDHLESICNTMPILISAPQLRELIEQPKFALKVANGALLQWEKWYSKDSTEFNRDFARELGIEALAAIAKVEL